MPRPVADRRIQLLVSTQSEYARRVLRGALRRLRSRAVEDLDCIQFGPGIQVPEGRPDAAGILTATTDPVLAGRIAAWGLPAVNACLTPGRPHLPTVATDDAAIGTLMARHLLDQGYRRLLLVGDPVRPDMAARLEAARACARSAEALLVEGGDGREGLGPVLARLERPCAALAANDAVAWRVQLACRRQGLHIPADLALIGADDESAFAGLTEASLSTVDVAAEEVGAQAADLLLRLLDGGAPPAQPLRIPPRGVIPRGSSGLPAVEDPAIAAVLRRVALDPRCGLDAMLAASGLPRRSCERRFRAALGHSPAAYLLTRRLERAAQLLRGSDLPVRKVALRVGFRDPVGFQRAFVRRYGGTPGQWRREPA